MINPNAIPDGSITSSKIEPSVLTSISESVHYADVVDNLDSTETNKPLSANQGRVLDGRKQDKTSLVSDIATKVNALSSSDKAAFLGNIGAKDAISADEDEQSIAEAIVSLAARIDALEERQGRLGNATAGTLDVSELTKYLYPTILLGHGVPSATNIPTNLPNGLPWDGVPVFIGQLYINLDASSSGLYYAKGHDAVSDWKQA